MQRVFLLPLLLALAACSKKPAAEPIQFAPGELHLDKTEIAALPQDKLQSKAFDMIFDAFKARNLEDWSSAAKSLPQPWRALYTSSELDSA